MTHKPGTIRVVARATAIIQDENGRVLLTWHPDRSQFFFPGGRLKRKNGQRLVTEFHRHPSRAAEFVQRLFTMRRRESGKTAGLREVCEELLELKLVPSPHEKMLARIRVFRSLSAVQLTSVPGDDTGYNKPYDTWTIHFPCILRLPQRWLRVLLELDQRKDPRFIFAAPGEITNRMSASRLRRISPDVQRLLERTGLLGPGSTQDGPPPASPRSNPNTSSSIAASA